MRTTRLTVFLLVLSCPIIGCSQRREIDEQHIREAVFRYQIKFYSSSSLPKAFFVPSASAEFLNAFQAWEPPVKDASNQTRDRLSRIRDKESGGLGYLLHVGHIKWVTKNQVEVEAAFECGPTCGASYVCVLKRTRSGWIVEEVKNTVVA